MNKVKIIMAVYNGERYLDEQIQSILASKHKDWMLQIQDDGSTDRTPEIAEACAKQYPEQIVFSKNRENLGLVANFLKGIEQKSNIYISGNVPEYYMFCDQDDVWKPEKISLTLEKMQELEKKYGKRVPALVFTDACVVDEALNVVSESFMKQSRLNPKKTDLAHLLMENKCIGCTVMMNAALTGFLSQLPKNGRFHDWWMALLAASFGHIAYVNDATLLYRQHSGNEVGAKGFGSYVKDRMKHGKKQKERLLDTQKQAEEFLQIYGDALPEKKRKLIQCFANLHRNRCLKRRVLVLRYRFFKTGLLRNLGVLLHI